MRLPDTSHCATPGDHAVAYAAAGIPVFAVQVVPVEKTDGTVEYQKKPHGVMGSAPKGEGGFKRATTDVDTVRRWWTDAPDASIGWPPGAVGCVVIDADGPSGVMALFDAARGELDRTTTLQLRTSGKGGGRHVVFDRSHRDGRLGNESLRGIPGEQRGDAGYGMLPDGTGYYTVDSDTLEAAPLPAWADELLTWTDPNTRPSISGVSADDETGWVDAHSGDRHTDTGYAVVTTADEAIRGADVNNADTGRHPTMVAAVGKVLTHAQHHPADIDLYAAFEQLQTVYLGRFDNGEKSERAAGFHRFWSDAVALRYAEGDPPKATAVDVDVPISAPVTGTPLVVSNVPKGLADIEPAYSADGVVAYRADQLKGWAAQPPTFRVRHTVVTDTHGVIGGPKKSLKSTATTGELAVSIANGIPWLDHDTFEVLEPRPVVVVVNEGVRSYMATLHRIAAGRGLDTYGDIVVVPASGVKANDPRLDQLLAQIAADIQPGVVIYDALYGFVGGDAKAESLFAMRDVFDAVTTSADRHGFDAWLVHHYKKNTRGEPDLDDLSWAGIAEWADSWLLLTHREPPRPDEGTFRLGMKAGSRQWGESLWEVDADLGVFNPDTSDYTHPPTWNVRRANHDDAARWGRTRNGSSGMSIEERILSAVIADDTLTRNRIAEVVVGKRGDILDTVTDLESGGFLRVENRPAAEGDGQRTRRRDRYSVNRVLVEQTFPGVFIPEDGDE